MDHKQVEQKKGAGGFYGRIIKRGLDIFLALVIFALTFWLYAILALLVRIKMGTPVIYPSRRIGYREKPFVIYKFRSMTNETGPDGELLPGPQRMTRFGRILRSTSLDELPSLFNILKGDMSFVGPRPLPEKYLPYYHDFELRRHSVRPGLTGWSQVMGRNRLTWDEKFGLDLDYVDRLSFLFDLRILGLTLAKVIRRSDILQGHERGASLYDERAYKTASEIRGKKLLLVTSDSSDLAFVEAARDLGVHVIACDRYEDRERSPAKKAADQAWDLDYKDIKAVAQRCREEGVDGVLAGYSEDRVLAACRIAREIGSPFYATEEQIEVTRDKRRFKELCREYGVRVAGDYGDLLPLTDQARENLPYPVIVKPSDSGGRKGITVCQGPQGLDEAIHLALSQSQKGEVVIEDYLEGLELSAVYTLSDGRISLSCLNDKYISEGEKQSQLCDLVLAPSSLYEDYLRETDPRIRALLSGIGARDGVVSFQFIAHEKGITAFEMGYRVNGNDDFKVISRFNGLNFMKMLIRHSLTGSMGDNLMRDNPLFPALAATLVIHLKGGRIGRMDYGELLKLSFVYDVSSKKRVGDEVSDNGTNQHKAMMVKMTAGTMDEMVRRIEEVKGLIKITDAEGEDMILAPFDTRRLQER